MNRPPYTITHDSITIIIDGKTHTTQKGTPNFLALRKAILEEDWDALDAHLTVSSSLEKWAKGKFSIDGDRLAYQGEALPDELHQRIVEMATSGEDPTAVLKFWERLQKNPSFRSVKQLWGFLEHKGIPLTPDGCFLAYKGVKEDYTDRHSGAFINKPGAEHKMARNQISDDPAVACHQGFHVGSLEYAGGFGARTVVCQIDPEHVVCVPNDSGMGKMRVCQYLVIGNHGAKLPSTVFKEEKPKLPRAKVVNKGGKKAKKAERKRAAGWTKFHNMDTAKLMTQGIMELRQYAGKGLLILGSSKIPGGKTALVARIIKIRKKLN